MLINFYNTLLQNNKEIRNESKINLEKALKEMAGKEYSYIKGKLADLLVSEICPVGKEINRLMSDKVHLLEVLKKGSEKARIIAEENLKNVRDKVGLI
jgi:tryptophanyl-tRNA synthetase